MQEQNGMILVSQGRRRVGSSAEQRVELASRFGCHPTWLNDDLPEQDVELKAFWIDRYPVTNSRYLAFTRATGHPVPAWWRGNFPQEYADHPVVGVSGKDAEAYSEWAGKRLPTSIEWEAAVSHPEGRLFPWGDEWPGCVELSGNTRPTWDFPETSQVNTGKHGQSASGVQDFAGQVSEWTSRVMPHHGVQFRMLRGASWFHRDPISYRSAFGYHVYEGWRSAFTGFRCALDAGLTPPSVPDARSDREDLRSAPSSESEGGIRIQAASGNSSHVSIIVPSLGAERFSLSAPEGVSWDGHSLLNWYDRRDLKWEVSTSEYARYVMKLEGLELKGEFATGDDYVDQVFTVTNHTGKPGWFRSSSCFNLQPNPCFYDCEGLRTYTLTRDDSFVLIRNFQRPGECIRWITGSVGPELENLHRAMLAVTSQDGEWVIGCARADMDGRFSVSCNTCFTCLHPDSSYPVDKSRSSRLRMYFLRGGLDSLLERFDSDLRDVGWVSH